MTTLQYGRIAAGVGAIVFVGALLAGATGAFFSDTETSTGNTFSAGDIDLQIDNTSYVTSTSTGALVASPANTWAISNLTNQLFFSFTDVKPGDIGEDTISVHAGSNNAWACMAARITATPENTLVDPETDAGDVGPANGNNGELQNFLNFSFWNDDGDNVFETGETIITPLTGPAGTIFNGNWLPIADSSTGTSSALTGNSTRFIGKAWCFGTLTPAPLANNASTSPLVRGTGFTCNGAGDNNVAQTDGIVVDVSFQAVQTRNNAQFLCSGLPPFGTTTPPIVAATGTLTVFKVLAGTSTDPTPPTIASFPLFVDGSSVTSGVATTTSSGAHVVSETGDPDYDATFSGGCAATSTVNVPGGGSISCTITNTFDGTDNQQ